MMVIKRVSVAFCCRETPDHGGKREPTRRPTGRWPGRQVGVPPRAV